MVCYMKFRVSTGTIVDAGFIRDSSHDYIEPSITANVRGDVVIAFTRSGATEAPSLFCAMGQRHQFY